MKVYIDGSNSFCTSRNTGIERVVRKLAENLETLSRVDEELDVSRVIHFRGKFSAVNAALTSDLQNLTDFEKNPTCFMNSGLRDFLEWSVKVINNKKIRALVLPESSHLGLYNLPFKLAKNYVLQKWSLQSRSVYWEKGDVLLLPDAYWTRRDIWKTVAKVRDLGVSVVSVFYDLIPISHVEFVGQRRSDKFRSYLRDLVKNTDLVLAISNTVRDELRAYASRELNADESTLKKIKSFRLGADIDETQGGVREQIRFQFEAKTNLCNTKPYVVVGSLDPRKNHIQVLDAFEKLMEAGNPRRLFFIGRSGGSSTEIIKRMENSPMGPDLLKHFCDLTDSELRYVYQNVEAAIMPSVAEGFGLPIVEALWHGNGIYASDIPIHREVGGSDCIYFPLHRPEVLAEMILENEGKLRRSKLLRNVPTSWLDSAKQVVSHCRFVTKSSHHEHCGDSRINAPRLSA